MTLVLVNAGSTESVELAWSEKAVKHLRSMGVNPQTVDASLTATKVRFVVANPRAALGELQKAGVL